MQDVLHTLEARSRSVPALAALDQEIRQRLERLRQLESEAEGLVQSLKHTHAKIRAWTSYRHWIKRLLGVRLDILKYHEPLPLKLPAHYSQTPIPANGPSVSIVTPSFNQAEFLERTLLSVLDQNYPRLEYAVQDGGSADDSPRILERYQPRLAHWESARDRGQAHAINLGFLRSSGEIMAYLNSDDLLLPGSVATIARCFADNPDVDVVYGHRVVINEDGDEVNRWVLPRHDDEVLSWADFVPQETLFWRRRIWERVGGSLDESFQFAMDWDLILRFRDAGARFVRLPRFLGAFRVHQLQKTLTQLQGVGEREMMRLRTRCHGRKVGQQEIRRAISGYMLRHAALNHLYRLGLARY